MVPPLSQFISGPNSAKNKHMDKETLHTKKWSETYAYGHQVLRTITVLILEILNIQLEHHIQ
jgi:hypothetical protein